MANPKHLRWAHDGKNTDGSAFGSAEFGGWEIEVNGEPNFSVPAGWETDGQYEVELASIDAFQASGTYTVRMRVVGKNGIASVWSNPTTFVIDVREPTAPFGLAVA